MPRVLHYKAPLRRGFTRIFIATPAYSGLSASYTYALFAGQQALLQSGIQADLEIFTENCHVDDGRNVLVRDFLETDCEQMIFLGADLRWNPSELIRLIQYDEDVVAGIYPLKEENESYPVKMIKGEIWSRNGLIQVEAVPTGFLKIKRNVLERLYEISPKFSSKADNPGRKPIGLIFERTMKDNARWGGDYTFCKKWEAIGGKIFIDPQMTFEHSGESLWNGCYGDFLRKKNNIDNPLLISALEKLKKGDASENVFVDIFKGWDNHWAASPELLMATYLMAKETDGEILETGSGISTLVLGMTGKKIHSLEHDYSWYLKVNKLLKKFKLDNVYQFHAPINRLTGFYEMPPFPDFSLALCDGPNIEIGRAAFYKMPEIQNATLIIDDAETELKYINNMKDITVNTFGERRKFAIIRRQDNGKLSEA